MNAQLPSAPQAKDQAKRLRTKMSEDGTAIGHAKSLELIAHQHGFRDWNAMNAAIETGSPEGWHNGDEVSGTYLSQPFTGKVIAVVEQSPGWFQLELQLDDAIDVVTSDAFSNLRARVGGVVGPKGHSQERTSDGKAHLQIDM